VGRCGPSRLKLVTAGSGISKLRGDAGGARGPAWENLTAGSLSPSFFPTVPRAEPEPWHDQKPASVKELEFRDVELRSITGHSVRVRFASHSTRLAHRMQEAPRHSDPN
jgi:hypothetical protein